MKSPELVIRFLSLSGVGASMIFIFWCVIDFISVKSSDYPQNVREGSGDLVFIVITSLVLLIANYFFCMSRRTHVAQSAMISVCATILSLVLGAILIWFLGIPFHFRIGGSW